MWNAGTYDPDLNLLYVGTGNPTPVLNGRAVPATTSGPAASSRSTLTPGRSRGASRPRRTTPTTGTPRKCRCWSTATFGGTPRKMLLQASRNGYFFVLDRTNGKSLLTTTVRGGELGRRASTRTAGRFRTRTRSRRATAGWSRRTRAAARTTDRRASIRRPACSSSARRTRYGIYFFKPEHGEYGWAGADYGVWSKGDAARDRLPDRQDPLGARPERRRAVGRRPDHRVGRDVHRRLGDQRARAAHERRHDAVALRRSAASANSPITYELDGRQFVLVASAGSVLYAFALPVK